MKYLLPLTVAFALVFSLSPTDSMAAKSNWSKCRAKKKGKNTYAVIETNKGKIVACLFQDRVNKIVGNFTMLAEGKHPAVGDQFKGKKFYDNLTFHRIIPKFMIQGGCPKGNGTGSPEFKDPKYTQDQFHPDLKHDRPGLLSMANSGKNTNGSQFFITTIPTPWLDNKHAIFGEVIEGMDVVKAIENVPTKPGNAPKKPITIKSVRIKRI